MESLPLDQGSDEISFGQKEEELEDSESIVKRMHEERRKKKRRRRKKKKKSKESSLENSLENSLESGISSGNEKSNKGNKEDSIESLIKSSAKKRRKKKKKSRSKNSSKGSSQEQISGGTEENSSGNSSQNSSYSKITYGRRDNVTDNNRKLVEITPKPKPGYSGEKKDLKGSVQRKVESFQVSQKNSRSRSSSSASSTSLVQQALIKRKLHVYYEFIEDTIKEDSIYELTGISLNIFFLLRLVFLELMMVVFQTMPLVQVLMMNFVNIAYFMWAIRAIFKDKVLEDTCDVIHIMVLETAIQVFLFCTIIFWMNREGDFLGTVASIIFQMICVFAIGVAVLYELVMLVVNLIKNIGNAFKRRKVMKEQISGLMAEVLGRKDIGRNNRINYRGAQRLNARIRRGF